MTKLKQKSLRGRCTTIPVRSSSPPQVINIDTWKRWKRFQIQNASQDHSGPDVHILHCTRPKVADFHV